MQKHSTCVLWCRCDKATRGAGGAALSRISAAEYYTAAGSRISRLSYSGPTQDMSADCCTSCITTLFSCRQSTQVSKHDRNFRATAHLHLLAQPSKDNTFRLAVLREEKGLTKGWGVIPGNSVTPENDSN